MRRRRAMLFPIILLIAGTTLRPAAPLRADDRPAMPEFTPASPEPATAITAPAAPTSMPAAASQPASDPLKISFASADHRSRIYYARDAATLSLFVENPTAAPAHLHGNIVFGLITNNAAAPFKVISITPMTPAAIAPHQRSEINLSVAFAAPGSYELRWDDQPIAMPAGMTLQCIFPPRAADTSPRWIARLPAAAALPGFLADYVARTGISRFVMDVPWPARPDAPASRTETVEMGGSLDAFWAQCAAAKVHVVVRFGLPWIGRGPLAEDPPAFHARVAAFLAHANSTVEGIVVQAEHVRQADPASIISCYLAAYDVAKKHDKNIPMLGLGSARWTEALLFHTSASGEDLLPYVDALATADEPGELARLTAGTARWQNRPLWLLPAADQTQPQTPPALALAQNFRALPAPLNDRGATLHLFSGAVLYERVHPASPYTMNVFQADGYTVATLCGPGAGSPGDAAWPALQTLDPKTFPTALEVADEGQTLRVVDEAGYEVNCRIAPDVLQIPLNHRVLYLLQTGSAQDLVALLRSAPLRSAPFAEAHAVLSAGDPATLKITLRNATTESFTGKLRLLQVAASATSPPTAPSPKPSSHPDDSTPKPATPDLPTPASPATAPSLDHLLGSQDCPEIAAGKSADFNFPLAAPLNDRPQLILEISSGQVTQRLPVLMETAAAMETTRP